MSDNSVLPATGDSIRDIDRAGVKTQVVQLDAGGASGESLVSTSNPLPVTNIDCATLLSTTVNAVGASASMDTKGYAAVVVQISGIWQGAGYFEVSNDGTNWDTILVLSRDSLPLQDIVTQNGTYTIRPSGRYLHFVVTNITGTATVVALGRAAEGIGAGDILSLAMDQSNNTPLCVKPVGTSNREFAQDQATGSLFNIPPLPRYKEALSLSLVGNIACNVDCSNYATAFVSVPAFGGGAMAIEGLFNEGWKALQGQSGAISSQSGGNISTGVFATFALMGAERIRVRCTTTASLVIAVTLQLSTQCVMHSIGVYSAFGASLIISGSVINTPVAPTTTNAFINSAASTNATSIKASAGTVYGAVLSNTGAAAAFVKFYNKASAPTVGTDVPVLTITVPASGSVNLNHGSLGIRFATGIALAITNLAPDTDTTAVAAAQVKVATSYI